MKISVTIDQPTGDFQKKLLALLAEHAAHVETDTTWTKERASRYYLALPARAQRIVKEAADRDGYVGADDLRDTEETSLRGHSAALKRILDRGVREGWWPDGMEPPIQAQGPGFGKVVGYRMPDGLTAVFRTAIYNWSRDWGAAESIKTCTPTEEATACLNGHISECQYATLSAAARALEKPIRDQGGTWDTRRAVDALRNAGLGDGDKRQQDKRARQALRDLAIQNIIVKTDPDSATYRLAEQ
ncbi:hypothetical protein ACIBI8_37525 [Streptomyces sp. NPDC050529]|uniref:hypothetical protein n=1 Tax=Streptomyces sp. NPDC050529 TaxID=3365624 RepID=UPI0037A3B62D